MKNISSWKILGFLTHLLRFGYAVPAIIVSVGVLFVLQNSFLNNNLFSHGLSSSVFALLFGLMSRYFIVGFNYLDGSSSSVSSFFIDAAKVSGASSKDIVFHIYYPLMRRSIIVSFFVVAIDIFKELPIILLNRPVGWDTVSVKIFHYVSEGEWNHASFLCLISTLVCVSFFLLISFLKKEKKEVFA